MSTRLAVALRRWVDSGAGDDASRGDPRGIDWPRVVPFVALHLGCVAVFWTGWSPFAIGTAVALYAVRMFAITAFYHRYFSHRAFRTSRFWQFVWPIKADYRISYLSPDYGQTIIARDQRDYVWIMARTPFLTDGEYQQLVQRVTEMGYDPAKLRKVPHRSPAPADAHGPAQ